MLLEYDDERAGSFDVLRDVPDDKMVVLGLVSTKIGDLEALDVLEKKVLEAARFHPMDRLAVSPQCGFATSVVGNDLTYEDQSKKLERVVEPAEAIWGAR